MTQILKLRKVATMKEERRNPVRTEGIADIVRMGNANIMKIRMKESTAMEKMNIDVMQMTMLSFGIEMRVLGVSTEIRSIEKMRIEIAREDIVER